MRGTLYWNVDHDIAYIKFDTPLNATQFPAELINKGLWNFYNVANEEKNVFPFVYNIWDKATDSKCIGLAITESMELSDLEAATLCESILDSPQAADGPFAPQTLEF